MDYDLLVNLPSSVCDLLDFTATLQSLKNFISAERPRQSSVVLWIHVIYIHRSEFSKLDLWNAVKLTWAESTVSCIHCLWREVNGAKYVVWPDLKIRFLTWSRPRSVSSHQQMISRGVVICPPAALLELNSWSITQMRCFQHCIRERLTAGQQAALILAGAGEIHKLSRRDDVPQLPWGGVFHNTTALKNTQQDFQFL